MFLHFLPHPLFIFLALSVASLLLWVVILLLPWRPWRNGEVLDARPADSGADLSDVTVLIPARNEAEVIQRTLRAVAAQGTGLSVVLIDDASTDATAELARQVAPLPGLTILSGTPLPAGWSGKLWALEQGRRAVRTPYTMLMDADIELAPGLIATLRAHARREGRPFVSLMAVPPLGSFWEKLLMPAFVYFFKLLYPFRLANSPRSRMAAAAGGCVFLETRVLKEIGGFAAIREALIDDCSLAARVKGAGHPIWVGLTHSAHSVRPYKSLGEIWNMVARTAFVQLRFSVWLLLLCTFLLVLSYGVPVLGAACPVAKLRFLGAAAWLALSATYLPTLRFYRRSWFWAPSLPLIGLLYLLMTWTSAIRCWRGERSRWKGRIYSAAQEQNSQ